MQCIRPLKAGYSANNRIVFSQKLLSNEFASFAFECRRCLACRLNIAREKAVRCWHESKMHEDCIFLTLTYDQEHLKSPKLQYLDFQLFMKSLREKVTRNVSDKETRDALYIPFLVTGEYGDKNKRPHWHAILFNYRPSDAKKHYRSDSGDDVYTSEEIAKLWKKGNSEFGSVTIDSANYVARYSAKKLVHGNDQEHDYHPIHKTSSRRAIGKAWISENWKHTFENGFIVLPNGSRSKIPRYYVDWLKKNKPDEWAHYVTVKRPEIHETVNQKQQQEELEYLEQYLNAPALCMPLKKSQIKNTILKQKFNKLQKWLKL